MKVIGKNSETLEAIWDDAVAVKRDNVNWKREFRKEIRGYIQKYDYCREDINLWEKMTHNSLRNSKLSAEQLNDCIMFIINRQLTRERLEKIINSEE